MAYAGTGRPPKFCLAHRKHKRRDRQRLEERAARATAALGGVSSPAPLPEDMKARHKAQAVHKRDGVAAAERAIRAGRARRLAVALGLTADPAEAADLAGIDYADDAELAHLTASARADHEGLTTGKPEAVGRVLAAGIALGACRLFESIHTVAPGQLAAAIKAAAQALELLQGDTDPVYSELRMVFRTPEGAEWTPDTLLPPSLRPSPTPAPTATSTGSATTGSA